METLLHYVWKHKLYDTSVLFTLDGSELEILDPGIHNSHAGPDFFNAKIKIDSRIWAGNVEIHAYSSDWYKHNHDKDKAYNSVILHVIEHMDQEVVRDKSGRIISQFIVKIPDHIQQNYQYLLTKDASIPCMERIPEVPEIYLADWKSALTTERLERKTNALLQLLDDYNSDWNEVFYITLSRNFGFGINNDAFERLAKSLPLKYIHKHQESKEQVEALFFGQAGMLEDQSISDSYFLSLKNEYQFLRRKYQLQPLESHIFKSLRIRPNNFPHIKIAQLAGFIRSQQHLFSQILEITNVDRLQSLFISDISEYWLSHYHFSGASAKRPKNLGLSAIQILLINTVVPILFAYGKKKNQNLLTERAISLLESIRAEKNSIITHFERGGISVRHAGDSQALIQLKREYCEQKKCIFCRIGHKLLSKQQVL